MIPDTISDFFKSSEKTTQPLKVIQRLGASHPIQQLNTEHPNHDESPFRLNRNSNLRERENLKSLNAERLGRNIVQTQTVKTESAIRIKFDNLPVGARVEKEREETPIDLDTGPVMVGP